MNPLHESEARIRAFADAVPAMLWETDPTGRCTFLSREWYSFTGQTEAQALGLGWTHATHPDDQAEAGRIFLRANTSREEFRLEYRLRGAGGEYRWALDVGRPRFTATGEYLGMVGAVIDIDERKQAEEALTASEVRRQLALEAAEVGMWHVDLATGAIQSDARFRTIFGAAVANYAELFAIIHPDDLPAVREAISAATRPDNPSPYAIEYRVVHPDGSLRWIVAKGRSHIDGSGALKRAASFDGTVADITDRKNAEEERERLVGRLQEQDQRKNEFLATLAHELRNPLAPIRNGLQIMRLGTGDPQSIERVREMMERQLAHMVHLIEDLLDLSRISRGKIELRRERVDLAHAIAQAVEANRPAISKCDQELLVDLFPGRIIVDGDLTRLAQVFSNLLNNASKFTGRGGRIELTVQHVEDEAIVSVRDNGIGMSEHMLPLVFDMFSQAESNLERSHGGLGIGLSIVKRLVEMHGGAVEARSEGLGSGSEFVVHIPVASGMVAPVATEHEEPMLDTGRKRILVVDDNRDAADSLAMMLTMTGNHTLTAYDGLEALDVAAKFKPDLVLLDIGMPKVNGYEVCRRLRQDAGTRGTVIVALTGWGQEEDKRRSLEAGFDAHLVKPVMPGAIDALVAHTSVADR
jgi:PAS domain S-box-containing protein